VGSSKELDMEFQKERLFTHDNADQIPVGSVVFVGNSVEEIKNRLAVNNLWLSDTLDRIDEKLYKNRFYVARRGNFTYAYLIKKPIRWTDFKVGEYIRCFFNPGSEPVKIIEIKGGEYAHTHIFTTIGGISDYSLIAYEKIN
jgi:hypothetical protein